MAVCDAMHADPLAWFLMHSDAASSSTAAGSKIGPRVRSARTALGLTQAELAKAIGVDQPRVSKIERGRMANVGPDLLRRLARTLSVSADHLLGTTDDCRPAVSSPVIAPSEAWER